MQREQQTNRKGVAPQGVIPFDMERTEITAEYFQGPYPHPRLLAEYDQVKPGLAEEITTGVREQRHHRQQLERWTILNDIIQSYIGQVSAFAIAALALFFGYKIVISGNEVAGFFTGFFGLTSLVTVFILGKTQQRRNLQSKTPPSKEIEKRK